jgi:hypothetical protein
MGTRSLTRVFDEQGKEVICMYRQMDGYPDGHGQDLADYLKSFDMVNGLGFGRENRSVANGYHCLAAQIVAHFKGESGAGGIYLYPPKSKDCGEEYEYHVKPQPRPRGQKKKDPWGAPQPIRIEVYDVGDERKLLMQCAPEEYADVLTTVEALRS